MIASLQPQDTGTISDATFLNFFGTKVNHAVSAACFELLTLVEVIAPGHMPPKTFSGFRQKQNIWKYLALSTFGLVSTFLEPILSSSIETC